MLGLPQQIDHNHFHVRRVIGNHQNLGRTSEEIDPHLAIQLTLGFGHIGIARANDHRAVIDGFRPQGHGGHSLHTTHAVDFIRTGQMHRRNGRGMGPAFIRRGAGDHPRHTGHLGGHDGHMGRGHHRITTTGHVTANAVHRNVLVAQGHTGKRLDLHILHGILLDLREVADLGLGKLDILDGLLGQRVHQRLDIRIRQTEAFGRPFVELLREFPGSSVAAGLYITEDAFNDVSNLGVGFIRRFGIHTLFQDFDGHFTLPRLAEFRSVLKQAGRPRQPRNRPHPLHNCRRSYLIACGLIGEPTPRVIGSGGATNMNS